MNLQRLRFWAGVALVSGAASAFAIAFRLAIKAVLRHGFAATDIVAAFADGRWWIALVPAVGGLCAGLLASLAGRFSSVHGVGGVMEAVVVGGRRLSFRATVLRCVASWCSVVSGVAVGREGAILQFGGGAGSGIGNLLGLEPAATRALIVSGVAAGFGSAYGTPLTAVLFVLEVIVGMAALEVLLPVMVATTAASMLTRWAVGGGPFYGVRSWAMNADVEVIGCIAIGAAGALVAVGFMQLLRVCETAGARAPGPRPLRSMVGGAMVGVAALAVPEVVGNGYEVINRLLEDPMTPWIVCGLLLAKALATAVSVGTGNPGGVFTPTLLLGALVGALAWHGAGAMLDAPSPAGAYILIGMAAAIAATTHAPLMAAVLVFELSGDYAMVVPLLLATATSVAVARLLGRDSLYMAELRRAGIRWEITVEGRVVETTGPA